MQVSPLPRDDSTNGWTALLVPPPKPARLSGVQRAHYAVIGAGVAGLAAARRLGELKPNSRIILLEAQRVGECSSGRNSGFIIDLPHEAESLSEAAVEHQLRVLRLNRFAIGRLRELVNRHGIDCEWAERGMYRGAVTEEAARFLDPYEQMIKRLGVSCTRVSRQELHQRLGSSLYCEAIHSPGTILVQPAALVRGLARSLPPNVELYENAPVTSLNRERGIEIDTPGASVVVDKLVLAVNGLLPAFGFMRNRLINLGLWASITRVLTKDELALLGNEDNWGMTPADARGGITMRRLATGRLLLRAITYPEPHYRPHTRDLPRIRALHCRILERRFPQLAPLNIEHTWTGFVSKSWNAAPAFGEVASNIYSACVDNGVGLARGTYHGELVADLVAGEPHDLLRDMLAQPRPSQLPPEPFTTWGARAQITWLEYISRGER
ncbi:MAG TPA: FAD-dependent oxidoreductase [Aestuariivirgaceae bacterium]|jgi:glycine/D-amino acid oxidase-like deaminating enzyme